MYILDIIQNYFFDKKIILNFIKKNKKYFFNKKKFNKKNKILVENFNFKPSLISFSYFAEVLSKKYNADIFFYYPNEVSRTQKIKNYIKDVLGTSNMKILESIGSRGVFSPKLTKTIQSERIFNILSKIKNKKDILNIKILSIPVGDLIYDEYLYTYKKMTIDVHDQEFQKFLRYSVDLFLYWYNYLDKKIVKSVIISHTSYFISLPGRIAAFKKISCYCVSNTRSFYITKDDYLNDSDFSLFPKIFKKIPSNITKKYIPIAKKKILTQFIKKNKIDFRLYQKKIKNYQPIKILVAAHCFTDAVHIHGKDRIFSDHYEWIRFLGLISTKTNYEWLIKIHPSQYDNNYDKMNSLISSYPKLKILSKNTKNIDLLKQVDYVLTVYGTVAREYPLFNIPVLNCSHDGPYSGYKFSHNFKNFNNYKKALLNIEDFKVNKKELKKIYEQFTVKYLINYYFLGYKKQVYFTDQTKNHNMNPINIIRYWNNHINQKKHLMHLSNVGKFINSKKHYFHADNSKNYSRYKSL